jgi:hypothetical protein
MATDKKPDKKPRVGPVRGDPPKVPEGAPLYRVTEAPHFINGRIVYPDKGEDSLVRYAGVPGVRLEPVDDAAKAARKKADADRDARKAAAKQAEETNARLRGLIQ